MKKIRKLGAILLAIMLTTGSIIFTGCGDYHITDLPPVSTVPDVNNPPSHTQSRTDDPVGFQLEPPASGEEYVLLETSKGDIKIRLFPESAPLAVQNFTTHVRNGYYDELIFHRVVENFMLQTGDPEGTGMGGESIWGPGFGVEANRNLKHFRGALSMANQGARNPQSNTSQFFIVQNSELDSGLVSRLREMVENEIMTQRELDMYLEHGGTPMLDPHISTQLSEPFPGHPVFGQVFYGMDVVDAIAAVEVEMQPGGTAERPTEISRPTQKIYIIRATIQTMD